MAESKVLLCKDCHRAPVATDGLCRACKEDQEEGDFLEEHPPGRPMRPYGAAPPDEDAPDGGDELSSRP